MANSQKRTEKEQFFAHLDSLDDDDEDVEELDPPINRKILSDKAPNQKAIVQHHATTVTTSTIRDVSSCLPDIMTKARPKTQEIVVGAAGVKRPAAGGGPKSKRQKVKPGPKEIPEENKIFKGLVFYFMPNDDVFKPRRSRIQSAVAHGAVWARSIGPAVTHVVTEADIYFNCALKLFSGRPPPEHISLVKENWLTESLAFKFVKDVKQKRFNLRGAPAPLPPKTLPTLGTSEQAVLNINQQTDLEDSRGHKQHASLQPSKISTDQDKVSNDELDKILQELKSDKTLAMDSDINFDSLISFMDEDGLEQGGRDVGVFTKQKTKPVENRGFTCMEKNDGNRDNPNARTINILQQMASYYDRIGDNWRTLAYRKAMTALAKQTEHIGTKEQALAIPGVGDRLADKIEEIVTTNRLRRLENALTDPDDQVLQLFMGIYGVGYAQARKWIARGYRTLEDLSTQADLTENQKVGLDHYDDFQRRIPREQVKQHAEIVKKAMAVVDPKLEAIVGGSYRRGNADSGDIDLIITKPNASSEEIRTLLLDSVIPQLMEDGFLKHALASRSSRDDTSKWHGVSALPGNPVWRRIDLLFVPWDEIGAALIYFTGNDIFNRSIRLLASRKGMRLNQHGLYADVMRGKGRERVTDGRLVEGRSERKIFEILGVPWRPPQHRKC